MARRRLIWALPAEGRMKPRESRDPAPGFVRVGEANWALDTLGTTGRNLTLLNGMGTPAAEAGLRHLQYGVCAAAGHARAPPVPFLLRSVPAPRPPVGCGHLAGGAPRPSGPPSRSPSVSKRMPYRPAREQIWSFRSGRCSSEAATVHLNQTRSELETLLAASSKGCD